MGKRYLIRAGTFLIMLTVLIFSLVTLSKHPSFPIVKTDNINLPLLDDIASPSAMLTPTQSPTPSPLPIPAQWGKQVRVPILLYHYIGKNPNPADKARDNLSVDPELFDKQLNYLSQNGFTPISLDALYSAIKGGGQLPGKPVILTFDDGYMDFYYNAFPILKRYNFVSTVFIPTALMDQGYYLTWGQISEMSSSGLVSFQSHSVNHINLNALNIDKLKYQLIESKNILQSKTGKPVNFIAYPYGFSNEIVWEAVKKAGYQGALGTWYGTITSEGTLFDMPRVKIPGGVSVEDFSKRF